MLRRVCSLTYNASREFVARVGRPTSVVTLLKYSPIGALKSMEANTDHDVVEREWDTKHRYVYRCFKDA